MLSSSNHHSTSDSPLAGESSSRNLPPPSSSSSFDMDSSMHLDGLDQDHSDLGVTIGTNSNNNERMSASARRPSDRRLRRNMTSDGSTRSMRSVMQQQQQHRQLQQNPMGGDKPPRKNKSGGERYMRRGTSTRALSMDTSDHHGGGVDASGQPATANLLLDLSDPVVNNYDNRERHPKMDASEQRAHRAASRRNLMGTHTAGADPDLFAENEESDPNMSASVMGQDFDMSFSHNNILGFAITGSRDTYARTLLHQNQKDQSQQQQQTEGHAALWEALGAGRFSSNDNNNNKELGSTMFANRGSWNQVDQSVNLMDDKALDSKLPKRTRSSRRRKEKNKRHQRSNIMDIFFAQKSQQCITSVSVGSNNMAYNAAEQVSLTKSRFHMVDVGLGPDPTMRRANDFHKDGYDNEHKGNRIWNRLQEDTQNCGSHFCNAACLVVALIVIGLGLLLLLGMNTMSGHPVAPLSSAAPMPEPSVAPTVANTEAALVVEEEVLQPSASVTRAPNDAAAQKPPDDMGGLSVDVTRPPKSQATPSPTAVPTPAAAPADFSTDQEALWNLLQDIFIEHNITKPEIFADTTTDSYQALSWMSQHDPVTAGDDVTKMECIERFAVVILYFATHPDATPDNVAMLREQTRSRQLLRHRDLSTSITPLDLMAGKEWMTPELSVCHWKGVHCHPIDKHVLTINVTNTGLSGTLPQQMAHGLPFLKDLDLSQNDIAGEIPIDLAIMTSLKNVDLSSNKLQGTIPASLSSLEQLETLHLENNDLTNMPEALCSSKSQYNLEFVAADCIWKLQCKCCDQCY